MSDVHVYIQYIEILDKNSDSRFDLKDEFLAQPGQPRSRIQGVLGCK